MTKTTPFVKHAYDLFIETLALETTDINTDSHKWHDLYSKECELFDMMRRFTTEETMEYAQLMCEWRMYKDTDPNLLDWTTQTR